MDFQQADARFYGVELQATCQLLREPYDLNVRVFGDKVRGKLPRITPARLGIGLDGGQGPFKGSLSYMLAESQTHRAALESATDGYSMLAADVSYRFRLISSSDSNIEVFLRGRNLLNEEARRATSFLKDVAPLPGVSVLARLRVVF